MIRTQYSWQTQSNDVSCKPSSTLTPEPFSNGDLLKLLNSFPHEFYCTNKWFRGRSTRRSHKSVSFILIQAKHKKHQRLMPSRSFEVNIGIIAACAPILRPFTRYIKARITGQDPHHILREFPTRSFHSSWYSRFRRSKSSAREPVSRRRDKDFNCPENGWGKAMKGGDASNKTDVTVSLPIQGVREREDSRGVMMPESRLKMYDSGSTLSTKVGAAEVSRDAV